MKMDERQLFYDLINFENVNDYGDLLLKSSQIIRHYIQQIAPTINYFEYNEHDLDEFLLKDNQQVQESYASYVAENPPARSREDMIEYLRQLTPAKFVDGAWLQGIGKAQNLNMDANSLKSDLVNDLFNIYVEELGEGVVEMNHVAIWQQLLGSVGINLPEPASHAFAFHPSLWDSSFVVGIIQLSLGHLASSHLPEILGYNMGFEQLPLHLLTTVDELRKLNIDPYYFQLHISIDNLASGHGAVATYAVKKYMDDITTRLGKEKADEHWRRILAGFYLNNVNPMKPELTKFYASPKTVSLEDKMVAMLNQKIPYAHQMHADREIGGCPINHWLSPNTTEDKLREFLSVLLSSHWVDLKCPKKSQFLTDLCGFGGAMFHVFTRDELVLIHDWIVSETKNSPQETTPSLPAMEPTKTKTESAPKSANVECAKAMASLLREKSARASKSHGQRSLRNAQGTARKLNELLEQGRENEAMEALKHSYDLDSLVSEKGDKTVDEALADNAFYKSVASGRMKNYFSENEVQVIKNWIVAGAPLLQDNSLSPSISSISSISPIPSVSPSPSLSSSISFPSFVKPTSTPHSFGCPFSKQADKKIPAKFLSLPSLDEISPPDLSSLFYHLINVDLFPHSFSQAKKFLETHLSPSLSSPHKLSHSQSELESKIKNVICKCDSLQQLANIGKQFSLFFLLEGICIQNVNLAGFHHTHMNSELMKVFMNIWGYENPQKNHHHMYNNLLKLLRVQLPPLNSSFISNGGFSPKIVEFAVLQLSVSLFPRTYFTEILAFLEWNLSINKVILENMELRISALGGYLLDSFHLRMKEYEENIQLVRLVIESHKDEQREDSPALDSRLGNAKTLVCSLASSLVCSLES